MNEFGIVPDSFFLPQSRVFVVSPVVWVLLQAVDERREWQPILAKICKFL